MNALAEAVCRRGRTDVADVRSWCLDCYGRREPWVLRSLGDLGVEFRRAVLVEKDVCRSCRAPLPVGLHAVVVTIPSSRPERMEPDQESG